MPKLVKSIHPDTHFRLLNLLEDEPTLTQRDISSKLGISLGAVNYCVKALITIGHIKTNNFVNNPNKSSYLYLLTPKGVVKKARLGKGFLKRKIAEFQALEMEIQMIRRKTQNSRDDQHA